MDRALVRPAVFANYASRKLARRLFHAMAKFGPKLERQQVLLSRFVDIGTELFAITATLSRAQHLIEAGGKREEIIPLVDYFCRESRLRICNYFRGTRRNNDREGYKLARSILDGNYGWMEDGIVGGADRG